MKGSFKTLVKETFDDFWNMNYYIIRKKEYNPKGRMQDEEGAKKVDVLTRQVLQDYNIPFEEVPGDRNAAEYIDRQAIYALKWPL